MHTDIPGAGEEIDLQTAEKLLRSLTQKNEQGNHTWHEVVSKHVTHLESSFKGLVAAGSTERQMALTTPTLKVLLESSSSANLGYAYICAGKWEDAVEALEHARACMEWQASVENDAQLGCELLENLADAHQVGSK